MSFGVVILMLSTSPMTVWVFMPMMSMAEQSSVICIASFAAFVSAPFMRSASKTCGVCTRTVLLRSTVPVTLPSSSTAFSVSVLGMTGMEDICTLAS